MVIVRMRMKLLMMLLLSSRLRFHQPHLRISEHFMTSSSSFHPFLFPHSSIYALTFLLWFFNAIALLEIAKSTLINGIKSSSSLL
jgi:hypothetical protein